RHTRLVSDWSSDVCSSDLALDGECYVGHLLPLSAGKRGSVGVSYDEVAALFVRKAALATPSRPEIIAKTYKLTPTELRVLLAIEIGRASCRERGEGSEGGG